MNEKINFEKLFKLKNNLDEFLSNYNKSIPLVLYGFGGGILGMVDLMRENQINVIAICDRDSTKHGISPEGVEIISFENALANYNYFNVYICVSNSFNEIREYLKKYIGEDRIFGFGRKKNLSIDQYRVFLSKNKHEILDIYNNLEDELSKRTMLNVISGTFTNDLKFFQEIFTDNQYFPKDIVTLSKNEIFLDGGAFDGDSIKLFLKNTNDKFDKIYAFEPDKRYANKILDLGKKLSREEDILIFEKALYSKKINLKFNVELSRGAYTTGNTDNEGIIIQADSIDECVNSKITFIKLDIEGSELEALKGAKCIIKTFKPTLAICVYHKCEDILEIPKYIMSLGLNYKYYLRHHTTSIDETVFYAIFDREGDYE